MYSKTFDTYGREKINDIYTYIYIYQVIIKITNNRLYAGTASHRV